MKNKIIEIEINMKMINIIVVLKSKFFKIY